MSQNRDRWQLLDATLPLLTYEYSFGPGLANTLAVGVDGGLVLVSPPCNAPASAFDELAAYGPVRALVASNAYHHMGLKEWHARFPDAVIAAPAQSVARVKKQTGIDRIVALADAPVLQDPRVEFIDMPHYKTGEVFVRAKSGAKSYWYVTDVVMNMPRLPKNPLFGLMFKLSDTGPGLKFNNIAALFMMKDKASVKSWLASEVRNAPPTTLIPCHGPSIEMDATASQLLALVSP